MVLYLTHLKGIHAQVQVVSSKVDNVKRVTANTHRLQEQNYLSEVLIPPQDLLLPYVLFCNFAAISHLLVVLIC